MLPRDLPSPTYLNTRVGNESVDGVSLGTEGTFYAFGFSKTIAIP